MKGISHFAVGIAAASCFPPAVEAGGTGNPLYFILAGIAGILPDTLDFKFTRFFCRHDAEVVPDPNSDDPRMIADAVASTINSAFRIGKPLGIKLNTIRMGVDLWRRYTIRFDVAARKVIVSYGPLVDTGGTPLPQSSPKRELRATAPLECDLKLDYTAATEVDIFDGPVFRMAPTGDGRIAPLFIPWHRKWTHSLVMAFLFALMGTCLWGWLAGLVVFCGLGAHILIDQMGFMGSNLFYPFTSGRSSGWKFFRSNRPLPNFLAVWTACLLIFWNLYAASPLEIPRFNPLMLLFYGVFIPLGLYRLAGKIRRS